MDGAARTYLGGHITVSSEILNFWPETYRHMIGEKDFGCNKNYMPKSLLDSQLDKMDS